MTSDSNGIILPGMQAKPSDDEITPDKPMIAATLPDFSGDAFDDDDDESAGQTGPSALLRSVQPRAASGSGTQVMSAVPTRVTAKATEELEAASTAMLKAQMDTAQSDEKHAKPEVERARELASLPVSAPAEASNAPKLILALVVVAIVVLGAIALVMSR